MRWRRGRRSSNVIDRRGVSARGGATLSGGALIFIFLVAVLLGYEPSQIFSLLNQVNSPQAGINTGQSIPQKPGEVDEASDLVSVVLADTEDTWRKLLPGYVDAKLVLFSNAVQSACGFASAASGPFYCPADNQVYLDTSFFDELKRLGAPGDFAIAYVIAHEIGHHIQTLSGISKKVREKQSVSSKTASNAIQVKMELQADCLAGVWANHAKKDRNLLEPGDLEEGLRAAAAIGDDRLQRMAGRAVQPESFTHGTSEQRLSWFKRGFDSGKPEDCNTFSG